MVTTKPGSPTLSTSPGMCYLVENALGFGVRQNERSAARTSLFKKGSALFEYYYHSVALLTPKSKNWPRFCSSARWYTTLAQPMSIAPVPIGRHTMR